MVRNQGLTYGLVLEAGFGKVGGWLVVAGLTKCLSQTLGRPDPGRLHATPSSCATPSHGGEVAEYPFSSGTAQCGQIIEKAWSILLPTVLQGYYVLYSVWCNPVPCLPKLYRGRLEQAASSPWSVTYIRLSSSLMCALAKISRPTTALH